MVLPSKTKIPIILLLLVIIAPTALAWMPGEKFSCTPDPCPFVTYRGWQVSTGWDNSTYNTTLGGTCVKDGGTNGDYCIRTCNMNEGCYGTVNQYSSGYYNLLDQPCAYGSTGFSTYGEMNLNSNNCYWTESVTVFDSNSPGFNYNWAHYYNGTADDVPSFFLFLDGGNHGGTSSLTNLEYIYLYPFGYSINAPPGPYDLIYTRYNTSMTEGRLTPTSGCTAGVTYDIWSEHYMYSIPRVSDYQEQRTCIQNAEIAIAYMTFQLTGTGTGTHFWDYTTPEQEVTRPSDNMLFITMQWADDTQDNGNYSSTNHTPYVNLLVSSPTDVFPLTTVMENFTVTSYGCGGTLCSATAQFYVNVSQLPDGQIWFFTEIDDGFGAERAAAGGNEYDGYVYKMNMQSLDPPTVTLNNPANGVAYPPGTYVNFNYTSISNTGPTVTNTIRVNNNEVFSATQPNGTHNYSMQFTTTGTYTWKVTGTDSYGSTTTPTRTFTIVDASNPTISSASVPNMNAGQNMACHATVVPGTYPVDKVWCVLSPQSVNINMPNVGGTSHSGFTSTTAAWATTQNWIIYANDTQGNTVNTTGAVQINHAPTFVSQNVNPASPTTYGPTKQYTFSSTWADDIGTSTASITFTSGPLSGQTFVGTKSGNTYTRVFTGLNAGTYQYYWTVTDNGGLQNTSTTYSYIINKATPTIINTMSPSFTVTTGTVVTGSCTVNNNTGGLMVYNKCGLQTLAQQTTPTTISTTPVAPSIGTYSCNCAVIETANWNAAQDIQTLTVNSATAPIVSALQPLNATIVDVGSIVSFNTTVTPGSFPITSVTARLWKTATTYNDYTMTNIGGTTWQVNVTMLDAWNTLMNYTVTAIDSGANTGTNSILFYNNHAPLPTNITVSPSDGQPYSPSTTYTFNITWTDDLDATITTANITIDGTEYAGTHIGSGKFTYQIVGLSTGVHNYTWTAWDSRGLSRTTSLQTYSVGVTQTILQIFTTPSISVVQGTQTTVNCTSNVPVSVNLYRNGAPVSNPDVQTLSTGTYTYICNSSAAGNYTAGSTSDILIVNPQNSQTQTQFCDGQLNQQYTYYNGSENYTMCVNLPCGANVTSARVNITGLPLFKLIDRIIGFFRLDSGALGSCTSTGHSFAYYYRVYCQNTSIYMNSGRVEMVSVRIINSTFNNTVYNLPLTYSNVKIENAYVLNGELISGTITPLTSNDVYGRSQGLYNITFDT